MPQGMVIRHPNVVGSQRPEAHLLVVTIPQSTFVRFARLAVKARPTVHGYILLERHHISTPFNDLPPVSTPPLRFITSSQTTISYPITILFLLPYLMILIYSQFQSPKCLVTSRVLTTRQGDGSIFDKILVLFNLLLVLGKIPILANFYLAIEWQAVSPRCTITAVAELSLDSSQLTDPWTSPS